ncbi:hypothetical protein GCM10010104_60540 [Streptomyces indiaensis]|uniref:Uncharacterized protein n=1 Tax=Streptomyces indiaensis TaxID=284033 RepID=A0ABN3EE55_9ACTN
MEEGSGPTGLRSDPTAQTLREIGTFTGPTRRYDLQLFRIIIPEITSHPGLSSGAGHDDRGV